MRSILKYKIYRLIGFAIILMASGCTRTTPVTMRLFTNNEQSKYVLEITEPKRENQTLWNVPGDIMHRGSRIYFTSSNEVQVNPYVEDSNGYPVIGDILVDGTVKCIYIDLYYIRIDDHNYSKPPLGIEADPLNGRYQLPESKIVDDDWWYLPHWKSSPTPKDQDH